MQLHSFREASQASAERKKTQFLVAVEVVDGDVRDAAELAEALNQGHALVPLLTSAAQSIASECRRRGWLGS